MDEKGSRFESGTAPQRYVETNPSLHWDAIPGSGGLGGGESFHVHESEDLPTAARSTPRGAGHGISGGRQAGDVRLATFRRGACDAAFPSLEAQGLIRIGRLQARHVPRRPS